MERLNTIPVSTLEDVSDALEVTRDKLSRLHLLLQYVCEGFFEKFADGTKPPEFIVYALPKFRAVALAAQDLVHDTESTLPSLEWLLESDSPEAAQDRAVKP